MNTITKKQQSNCNVQLVRVPTIIWNHLCVPVFLALFSPSMSTFLSVLEPDICKQFTNCTKLAQSSD